MDQINILLIDDEPSNVQVLFAALQGTGKVQFATNGEKALAIAEETPPDVVFLDYFMPEMDGLEVCKRLKANPKLSHAQVIFISGTCENEEVEAALDAGAFDFMSKPVVPKLVRRKLDIALSLKAGKKSHSSADTINTNPQKILLVEDGAINRAVIAEILESRNHEVMMAETGAEAIELVKQNDLDCILLDIHLPDMTGLKVIRHIRAEAGNNRNTRVIAVTGDVTAESLEDYREATFDGVAPKPVDPETLIALVSGESVQLENSLMSAPDIAGPDLLIEQERINVLKETYSESRLQGLFALFEKEASTYMSELKNALETENEQEITRTAHRLKSALGHFACARMQKIADMLNKEKDLPLTEKMRLVNLLEEQFPATLKALTGALDIQE